MTRTVLWCVLSAAACAGQSVLIEDPPLAQPPRSGDISGTVAPADQVVQLWATCRDNAKTYKPASLDARSGRFIFKDLPGDANYDLCMTLKDGRTLEGIDLGFADQRMNKLAQIRRRQLGLTQPAEPAFTPDDAQALIKFALDLKDNDFMDLCRVLYVRGDGPRAAVLVERMRTREFYDQKVTAGGPQVIWRVELWYFQNRAGGWERVANSERVLRRERIAAAQWRKISLFYLPRLSIHLDEDGKSQPVEFTIPAKVDPSAGRPADTQPKLDTKPAILGLPTTAPASKPAAVTQNQ